jgi:hypothetical protein
MKEYDEKIKGTSSSRMFGAVNKALGQNTVGLNKSVESK